jgi:hypothetical protein
MTLELRIKNILHDVDEDAWKTFLDTCTMQEAVLAKLKAQVAVEASTFAPPERARKVLAMSQLASKREQHLNGEHRHPHLWR